MLKLVASTARPQLALGLGRRLAFPNAFSCGCGETCARDFPPQPRGAISRGIGCEQGQHGCASHGGFPLHRAESASRPRGDTRRNAGAQPLARSVERGRPGAWACGGTSQTSRRSSSGSPAARMPRRGFASLSRRCLPEASVSHQIRGGDVDVHGNR